MKSTQLTRGKERRLMYVENKNGLIDGYSAHIGWVTFSKTGNTVYYRNLVLNKVKGGGVRGNFAEATTGDEFWISGVKRRGSNTHWAESVKIHVDEDAKDEYKALISTNKS